MSEKYKVKYARLSEDELYRYELWRFWEDGQGYCLFIGLNPSTADGIKDDPTIRRCVAFAKAWGYGGLCMANLFAFRSTDPRELKRCSDPIGELNDRTLNRLSKFAGIIVAAWGVHGGLLNRDEKVSSQLRGMLQCLGTTKEGYPRHPLYVRGDTKTVPFNHA